METSLKLLTFRESPALGNGVTLAIFQSTGISLLIKDKLKSSATFEGIATKASLIISLDRCSILEDLLILIPLHNSSISISLVNNYSSISSGFSPTKLHSLFKFFAKFGPIFVK